MGLLLLGRQPDGPVPAELARGAVRRTVLEKAARAGAEAPEVTLREQLTAGEDGGFVEWRVAADAKGYPSAK